MRMNKQGGDVMKDEAKEIKEGYEIIIRNQEGNEIYRYIYPLNCAISIIKNTYHKKNEGWRNVEMVFNNSARNNLTVEEFSVRKIEKCCIESVIKEKILVGDGTEKSPIKIMYNYWTLDGKFICQKNI